MALWVVDGALLQCSMGSIPSVFVVPPRHQVTSTGKSKATIMDHKPMTNIQPFGLCMSIANPKVAAATSAAMGMLTPQPCQPNTQLPWVPPHPIVSIENEPALDDRGMCFCMWMGMIRVVNPGQILDDVA